MVLKLVNDAKVQTRILYTKVAVWVDYRLGTVISVYILNAIQWIKLQIRGK